jgi:nuclear pore complex protein Nup210
LLHLNRVGLQILCPQPDEVSFNKWWARDENMVNEQARKGLNSLIILGAWTIWNHHKWCVFDGAAPSIAGALTHAVEELHLWGFVGAQGTTYLLALAPEGG